MTTHAASSSATRDSRSAAPGGALSDGRMRIAWIALTALAPAAWGTTYIVTTRALPPGHPVFAALMRTLPAGALALLAARQLPRGTWWWKSLVLGALNMTCFFPLLFVAAQRLPGGGPRHSGPRNRSSSRASPSLCSVSACRHGD